NKQASVAATMPEAEDSAPPHAPLPCATASLKSSRQLEPAGRRSRPCCLLSSEEQWDLGQLWPSWTIVLFCLLRIVSLLPIPSVLYSRLHSYDRRAAFWRVWLGWAYQWTTWFQGVGRAYFA